MKIKYAVKHNTHRATYEVKTEQACCSEMAEAMKDGFVKFGELGLNL
jgi:hypothetical protein